MIAMKNKHPYQEFEALPVWAVLGRGIEELRANGDIEEKTARRYIVGYLAKMLHESGLIVAEQPVPQGETR